MKTLGSILFLSLLLAAPLGAQDTQPVEIGLDGVYQISLVDQGDNLTELLIPSGSLRLGLYLTPRVALEPILRIDRRSAGDNSLTSLILQPNLVFYFREYDRIPQPYVRAGGGLNYVGFSGSSDDSETYFSAVGAVGVKVPVLENAFFRFEGNIQHYFDEDAVMAQTVLGLTVGIAVVVN